MKQKHGSTYGHAPGVLMNRRTGLPMVRPIEMTPREWSRVQEDYSLLLQVEDHQAKYGIVTKIPVGLDLPDEEEDVSDFLIRLGTSMEDEDPLSPTPLKEATEYARRLTNWRKSLVPQLQLKDGQPLNVLNGMPVWKPTRYSSEEWATILSSVDLYFEVCDQQRLLGSAWTGEVDVSRRKDDAIDGDWVTAEHMTYEQREIWSELLHRPGKALINHLIDAHLAQSRIEGRPETELDVIGRVWGAMELTNLVGIGDPVQSEEEQIYLAQIKEENHDSEKEPTSSMTDELEVVEIKTDLGFVNPVAAEIIEPAEIPDQWVTINLVQTTYEAQELLIHARYPRPRELQTTVCAKSGRYVRRIVGDTVVAWKDTKQVRMRELCFDESLVITDLPYQKEDGIPTTLRLGRGIDPNFYSVDNGQLLPWTCKTGFHRQVKSTPPVKNSAATCYVDFGACRGPYCTSTNAFPFTALDHNIPIAMENEGEFLLLWWRNTRKTRMRRYISWKGEPMYTVIFNALPSGAPNKH